MTDEPTSGRPENCECELLTRDETAGTPCWACFKAGYDDPAR